MGYIDKYLLLFVFLTSFGVILGASEVGRWFGVRARGRREENLSTLEGAIFGLLALMIGFTFAMAMTRFEARRDAVLNEANAIATAAMRARLLPDPHATETLKLLREYVELRLAAARGVASLEKLNAGIARSNAIQDELWQQAIAGVVAQKDPSMPTWLVFDGVNQLVNSQRRRLAVFRNYVPHEVLIALYGIATLAIAFAGYAEGLKTRPGRLPTYIAGVLACSVILLIVDLETPFTGFIEVSQQPLIDTAASLGVY